MPTPLVPRPTPLVPRPTPNLLLRLVLSPFQMGVTPDQFPRTPPRLMGLGMRNQDSMEVWEEVPQSGTGSSMPRLSQRQGVPRPIRVHERVQQRALNVTEGTGTWLGEGSRFDLVAGALVTPLPGGQVPILIINPLPTEAVIYKGTNVDTAKPFGEAMVAPVSEKLVTTRKYHLVSAVCCMT